MAKSAATNLDFTNNTTIAAGTPSAQWPNLVEKAVHELSFGQFLRRERVLRGISRREIIAFTKVSEDYLSALENNQFDRLPPKAFVVGFLRVLSRYAGLDSDAIVNRYLAEIAQREAYEESAHERQGFLARHYRKLLVATGFACLILLIFFPYFRGRV
jgi:cytoskeletal protein RodZ